MKICFSSIALFLLFLLPFVHWVGDTKSAVYIALLFAFAAVFRARSGKFPKPAIDLLVLLLVYLGLIALINRVTMPELLDFSSSGHLKLSYQATSLFAIVILLSMLPKLTEEQSNRLFSFYYTVFLTTIIGEWVLVNILGVSNSLMPTYRASPSYYEAFEGFYRPFGLTGNAPVNGVMLVLATWIMIFFVQPARAKYYLSLTLLALILNNSGQAFLSFFATCAMYFASRYKGTARSIIFMTGTSLLCGLIYSETLSKLSFSYILNISNYWYFGIFKKMDPTRIMFGGYSFYKELFADPSYNTEFYPVYAISRFGVLMTLVTWIYLWSRLPPRGRPILFMAIFLGCIHYPMIIYIPPLVLLATLIVNRAPAAETPPEAAR